MSGRIGGLAKNSVIYGVGTTLTRFIGLFLLPFFTAYLTPADYGILALLALLGQVLQPIFSLGLGAGMGPCYFEGNNERTKVTAVGSALFLLLVINVFLILLAIIFSGNISNAILNSIEHSQLVVFSLIGIAVNNITTPLTLRMQFEGKAMPFVIISTLSVFFSISLSVVMVLFLEWGVRGMIIAQLAGTFLSFFIFAFYVSRWTIFLFRLKMMRSLLRLGLPLVPSFAFLFILMHFNKYLLQWFSGIEVLGIYSIGFNFGSVMSLFTGSFQTAWFPYFMSFMDKTDEAKDLFGRVLSYYVAFFGSLVLLFFVFSRAVVVLMTQPDFHASYRIVGFVALAHFFVGLFSLILPPIYYAQDVRVVSVIQAVACIVFLPITWGLIYCLSSLGAAIGLALGFFSAVVLLFLWIYTNPRYLKINYETMRVVAVVCFLSVLCFFSLWERVWCWQFEFIYISLNLLMLLAFMLCWMSSGEKEKLLNLLLSPIKKYIS